MDSYQVQKSPAVYSGKIPEIHATFQRPFCIRESGGSIPGWSEPQFSGQAAIENAGQNAGLTM
jgi:hypothetical protein